jgi:hypothetical protein
MRLLQPRRSIRAITPALKIVPAPMSMNIVPAVCDVADFVPGPERDRNGRAKKTEGNEAREHCDELHMPRMVDADTGTTRAALARNPVDALLEAVAPVVTISNSRAADKDCYVASDAKPS